MAIDTENKRRNMFGIEGDPIGLLPSGSIGADKRRDYCEAYAYIGEDVGNAVLPTNLNDALACIELVGNVDLIGYTYPLYNLTNVVGDLKLTGYHHRLRSLKTVTGTLDPSQYGHKLDNLVYVNIDLLLNSYTKALPNLVSVGRDAIIQNYSKRLLNMTSVGRDANVTGYNWKLHSTCIITRNKIGESEDAIDDELT